MPYSYVTGLARVGGGEMSYDSFVRDTCMSHVIQMYICTCIYIHTFTCICVYVYMYIYEYACIYIYI